MHCPVCGREIPENSRYCPYCNAYVKNAPQQEEEEPVYSEQYLRTEARIDAMRRKNRRQRRLMSFIIFLILLIIAAVAISYGVDRLREHFTVEITTEAEVDTTEPLTAPPTTETPTDHFDPARESFAELTETFSGMIGSLASEYDLTAVPADEGYGSYAYTMDAYADFVFIFTGSADSSSARLRAVCGDIQSLLPGRSNYTYSELQEVLGDNMTSQRSGGSYSFQYESDSFVVRFTGQYMNSEDPVLDSFRLTTEDASSYRDETTEDPSQALVEEIREDPDAYFADNTASTYTVRTEGGELNMRAFAGTDNRVITTIPNGAPLTVYGFYDGWAYAETADGEKGWVSENYITESDSDSSD